MALESQKGVIQKTPAVFEIQQQSPSTSTLEGTAQTMYVQQAGRNRGRGNSRSRGGRGQSGPAHRWRCQSAAIAPANTNPRGPVPYQNGQHIAADKWAYCRKKGHWQNECCKRLNESGCLIKIFAVNQHEDQFGDPCQEQAKYAHNTQLNIAPPTFYDVHTPRGPPPGYPFPATKGVFL